MYQLLFFNFKRFNNSAPYLSYYQKRELYINIFTDNYNVIFRLFKTTTLNYLIIRLTNRNIDFYV